MLSVPKMLAVIIISIYISLAFLMLRNRSPFTNLLIRKYQPNTHYILDTILEIEN